ncbi:MAG TPA: DNA topoisomerase IB [Pseudonocardiaceae bacterium]|nr:DNA topoisomerase IB [Pseudonocardiaceae bacterium]
MARLRRSDPSGPGLTRRRSGRGSRYCDQHGHCVDETDRDRIRALAIPPAWREVWICPWPNGHIQATGLDDAGRRQYVYHERWRSDRDEQKFDRCLELAPALPAFRDAIESDLTGRGYTRERALAIALRMLDHGVFRVGGDEYVEQHGTHGAATLLREHVRVRGRMVACAFPAKGGIDRDFALPDPVLAKAVTCLRRARCQSERLLVYRDGASWREIHADDVNLRFKQLVGEQYSVKDLRTWNATVLAAAELAATPLPRSARARRKVQSAMFRSVAEHLGNTPAVAKKSYVDPRLLDRYEAGVDLLDGLGDVDLADDELRAKVERAVVNVLTE